MLEVYSRETASPILTETLFAHLVQDNIIKKKLEKLGRVLTDCKLEGYIKFHTLTQLNMLV